MACTPGKPTEDELVNLPEQEVEIATDPSVVELIWAPPADLTREDYEVHAGYWVSHQGELGTMGPLTGDKVALVLN